MWEGEGGGRWLTQKSMSRLPEPPNSRSPTWKDTVILSSRWRSSWKHSCAYGIRWMLCAAAAATSVLSSVKMRIAGRSGFLFGQAGREEGGEAGRCAEVREAGGGSTCANRGQLAIELPRGGAALPCPPRQADWVRVATVATLFMIHIASRRSSTACSAATTALSLISMFITTFNLLPLQTARLSTPLIPPRWRKAFWGQGNDVDVVAVRR